MSAVAAVPPEGPLTGLRWLRTVVRNPIESWPADIYKQSIFTSRLLGRDIVFVMAPELVRKVLVSSSEHFDKGEISRRALGPALGDALLTAEGDHWRWQRRAAAPTFRPEAMAPYYPAVQAAAEQRLTEWAALPDGALVNVAHEMMRTTFDAILDAMLTGRHSMDANRVERAITDYLSSTGWVILIALLGLPAWLPYPGRIRSEIARRFLKRAARQAVKHSQNSPDPSNLVACLAKASDPTTHRVMNEVDLTDNFITFMAAGHETTALALTWTWYLLALHPEVEERLTTEVQQCISGNGLSYIDLERLTYTRQVIEESMRLYPPAPLIVRRAITDVQVGDCLVRSGTIIYIPVYAIHRHEKLWSDPDKFDPDRFASDVASTRSRYAYLPFGAGPRICIGRSFAMMEAVAMLALLIDSYRLSLLSDYQPQMETQVTLRPRGGMRMHVSRRKR